MKFRITLYCILVLAFYACENDLSSVGMQIQPDEDKISILTDSVSYASSTIRMDSIYVRTIYGCLGALDDPFYRNISYGYMCNFYTSPDSVFRAVVVDNKVDSVSLVISYRFRRFMNYGDTYYPAPRVNYLPGGWTGDPLALMQLSVYGITKGKTLKKKFYNNVDPWSYTSLDSLWSEKTYTAQNSKSDSTVVVKLPVHVGQQIYNAWNSADRKEVFNNLDNFFKFFPGIYVKSTYGSGNVLNVTDTFLRVYYKSTTKDVQGQDSIYTDAAIFTVSEEVTQLNSMGSNREDDQKLIDDKTQTYIKTPSGVITEIEIPINEIVNKMGNKKYFNYANITLQALNQPEWEYTLNQPSQLLLIAPDSAKVFFEESRVANNIYSYYSSLSNSKYNFGNVSNIIQKTIDSYTEKGIPVEQWSPLKLWVIPVMTLSYDYQNPSITQNYFEPSGVILKTGDKNLRLTFTVSDTSR